MDKELTPEEEIIFLSKLDEHQVCAYLEYKKLKVKYPILQGVAFLNMISVVVEYTDPGAVPEWIKMEVISTINRCA